LPSVAFAFFVAGRYPGLGDHRPKLVNDRDIGLNFRLNVFAWKLDHIDRSFAYPEAICLTDIEPGLTDASAQRRPEAI
jgi:hypothetical protein